MKKIKVAVSMGDPAGIGPELALKVLSSNFFDQIDLFVIGDSSVLRSRAEMFNMNIDIHSMLNCDDLSKDSINVLSENIITPDEFRLGECSAICGKTSFKYIEKAIELALDGKIDAVVTNPINKYSLKLAEINYPGHTEIFAEKTGTKDYSMMFKEGNLSVVHVTTHCSLRMALKLVKKDTVLKNIKLLNKTLFALGVQKPRIGVAGLNPHAGEGGLFGTEEIDEIIPAIEDAKSMGINVEGPFPPDTIFMRGFKGEFDGIVSMLHDHGFLALKSRDFENGVNITVGLPIIRTSVGHGTAFDIVRNNCASPNSLIQAIKDASAMACTKHGIKD